MKLAQFLIPAAIAAFAALSTNAVAAPDEAAAKAFAKKNDCTKCHAVDKTKKGPSYQKMSAKYKGKADGEDKMTKHMTSSPKVKLEDGTEEEHKALDAAKDGKDIKNLVQWILAQ